MNSLARLHSDRSLMRLILNNASNLEFWQFLLIFAEDKRGIHRSAGWIRLGAAQNERITCRISLPILGSPLHFKLKLKTMIYTEQYDACDQEYDRMGSNYIYKQMVHRIIENITTDDLKKMFPLAEWDDGSPKIGMGPVKYSMKIQIEI